MTVRRYDAVLFDAGETIVRPEPSFGDALRALFAEHGHHFDQADVDREARAALAAASQRAARDGIAWTTSAEASRRFWTGIYVATLAALGVADDGDVAGRIYEQFTQPHRYALFPDALPALRELKASGYRLGLVSNWEAWLAGLLDRLGVAPLFDVAVVSGAEGVEKPDPRIFEIALHRMGVAPERAAYVGDSPSHDVEPAMRLGMGAVLVDRHGSHAGLYRPTISSLGLLTAVL